jgi:hypothetical protein
MTTKAESLQGLENVASSRKIAGNTFEVKYANGDVAIRFHYTNIITTTSDGIVLNSGTWRTGATKARLNEFSPVSVWQDKGVWYCGPDSNVFYDGIIYNWDNEKKSVVLTS